MRRRAGARHDSYGAAAFVAPSIAAAFCGDHFAGVWHARPPRSSRTPQVRRMVLRHLCSGSGGAGGADASRFALDACVFLISNSKYNFFYCVLFLETMK